MGVGVWGFGVGGLGVGAWGLGFGVWVFRMTNAPLFIFWDFGVYFINPKPPKMKSVPFFLYGNKFYAKPPIH